MPQIAERERSLSPASERPTWRRLSCGKFRELRDILPAHKGQGASTALAPVARRRPAWAERVYSEEVAILASDLSGLTRLTKKYGIIHFASIIARKRQLALPILHRHGALHVTYEADNLIVVIRDVGEAVRAALEVSSAIARYNETLLGEREQFRIDLNGIGVHCGCGVIVDSNGHPRGEVAQGAYYIGEELCHHGKVMLSEPVWDRISGDTFFAQAIVEQEEAGFVTISGAPGSPEVELAPPEDSRFLPPGMMPLARRHCPSAVLGDLDAEIEAAGTKRLAVLMFAFDLTSADDALEVAMDLKSRGMQRVERVLREHGGQMIEEVLWVFQRPADAVVAAVALRTDFAAPFRFRGASDSCLADHHLKISGYGVHYGPMLFIEGTDVHWGDPVNTSSKLSHDLAEDGVILVTPDVKAAAAKDPRLASVQFTEQRFTKFEVVLDCFRVEGEEEDRSTLPPLLLPPTQGAGSSSRSDSRDSVSVW